MELPTVVSIWSDRGESDSFLGSGCLLDRRHVLTAKHLVTGGDPVYVGLIPGAAERYRAQLLATHDEHDAAILTIDAETPLPVSIPVLMQEHCSLAGEPVHLLAISPLTKSRYDASNYSIGAYDEIHGEYELSPDNARGHSGGVVVWDEIIVGLLFARATEDPLCRAISMHRLCPWILKSAPGVVFRDSNSSSVSHLSVTWSGSVDPEFPEVIVIRPVTVNGGGLQITNRGPSTEKVNRMVLMIGVMRNVPDGMSIPVPALKFAPSLDDPLGRVWTETHFGEMNFQGPVTVQSGETWELPGLSLEWNEENIDSRRQLTRLVGVATLFIQLQVNIYSDSHDICVPMNVPLRVLDGEDAFGDGGVEALVEALQPADEAERQKLVTRYRNAMSPVAQIWDDWRATQATTREAQRLDELADELAELEEAVSLLPSQPEPLLKIANRYIEEKLPLAAAKSLDQAWELGLHEIQQLFDFAEMQISLGNRNKALAAVSGVVGPDANSARYFGLKAEALDDEDTKLDALANYDQAVAREPSSFRWHSGRGRILTAFEDRLDEAVHELDLAIELGADGSALHATRAIVFANQKKYAEAIAACREAIALGNTNISTFDWIAGLMPAGPRRQLLEILRTLGD